MSRIPPSMAAELQAWNNGSGIDLESWSGCTGTFAQAVGYAAQFWPRLVVFEGYILREGFSVERLRGFESSCNGDRSRVECVMNHFHIADLQYVGCPDMTQDKIVVLGETLREMLMAKLAWQFPDRPCVVDLYVPDDLGDLREYQLSFWQRCNGAAPT